MIRKQPSLTEARRKVFASPKKTISLRLQEKVHERAKELASKRRCTLSQLVEDLLVRELLS